jgi:hypothetical protein
LRKAWHQASDELPPRELDAAIIAAARKSVKDFGVGAKAARDRTRSRNWLLRWQPLAAAATVAGLAFILMQVMPRDRDVAPSIRMEGSAPGPVTPQPITTEPPAAERHAAEPAATERAAAEPAATEQKASGQLARESIDNVPAASANVVADQGAAAVPDRERAKAAAPAAPGLTKAVPQPADSGASVAAAEQGLQKRQRDQSSMSTADWTAGIVRLYETGDLAGAADSLRAFRAVHADADTYLPDSLRDWARTVK